MNLVRKISRARLYGTGLNAKNSQSHVEFIRNSAGFLNWIGSWVLPISSTCQSFPLTTHIFLALLSMAEHLYLWLNCIKWYPTCLAGKAQVTSRTALLTNQQDQQMSAWQCFLTNQLLKGRGDLKSEWRLIKIGVKKSLCAKVNYVSKTRIITKEKTKTKIGLQNE